MSKCDTVKIQNGDDYTIINYSDFDSKKNKLYKQPKPLQKTKEVLKK